MAKIEGVKGVTNQLKRLADSVPKETSVIVGYTASYALWVHEAVEMKLRGLPRRAPGKGFYWDPQGQAQAKFLETPARQYRSEIAKIAVETYKRTKNLTTSLMMAGYYLQRMSMQLVPVDTGNLKASAFTREEKE